MELYNQAFKEALDQNTLNAENWSNYKNEIKETSNSLNEFLKSCHMDILVPLGKKAYIRGKLQHTNDILVSHNSNYFSLMSNFQANELLKARSKTCDSQLKAIDKERKLFSDKLEIPKGEAFSEQEEIIEEYNEEEEAEWRKKHKESVKRQKLIEAEKRHEKSMLDNDTENLLDRYELLEEMAGELDSLSEDAISDEVLTKMLRGEINVPENKKRVARISQEEILDVQSTYILQKYEKNHDSVTSKPSNDVTENIPASDGATKKKKERRRVTFSSQEEVKVIVPAQEVDQAPIIQIKFHHSPGKFHPDPPKENVAEEEPKFAHPGELFKFVSSIKSTETKSILKSKGASKPKKSARFKPSSNEEDEDDEFESFLRKQVVIGDVIEHKNDAIQKPLAEVQLKPQKVSKFKEMRNKVK